MRLKKIAEELKVVIGQDQGKKKRTKKIAKLVDQLGRKKEKYQAKVKSAEGAKKKLDHKIEVCEAQLAKGRKAMKPDATKSAAKANEESATGNDRPANKKTEKNDKPQPKPGATVRPLPH